MPYIFCIFSTQNARMKTINLNPTCIIIFFLLFATACNKSFEKMPLQKGAIASGASTTKPNIILILGDDIGYEIPQYTGGQSYLTPNINWLAQNGIQFTQCSASPMCSPSRFMLMTGKYSFRNYTQWGIMDLSQRTIANMLQDAGYDTYVPGKWQFDGGDNAVHTFGFDDYVIFEPYESALGHNDPYPETDGRYKSPELFVNDAYMLPQFSVGNYCDDMLVDSLTAYASRSVAHNKPFFIYYSMSLCHEPFSPTPDDPEYSAWDPTLEISDTSYFPSMVNYMDKKIGEVVHRIDSMGLSDNTVILYVGDNGTPNPIYSTYKGQAIKGGKGSTNQTGTHVPFIIYWKGVITPGSINNDLIDFTDFLPTIAGIAGAPVPTTYGTLDGVSFYPRLLNQAGTPRNWVFCHYIPGVSTPQPAIRFIYNSTYKLYDSLGLFYNIALDPYEKKPIKPSAMTKQQRQTRKYFQSVLDTLH